MHNISYLRVFMAFLLPVGTIFLLIMLALIPLLIYPRVGRIPGHPQ